MLRRVNELTQVLGAIGRGEPQAAAQLLPLVYDELRRLAAQRLAREAPGQTLQATALVHEAYLRVAGDDGAPDWNGRGHFFGAAAEAMRRILIERARRGRRVRHGGGRTRIDLDQLDSAHLQLDDGNGDGADFDRADGESAEPLLALDEALTALESEDPAAAAVVKLRYFAGLTIADAAAALDISVRTANRHWAYAKARLYQQLNDGAEPTADDSSRLAGTRRPAPSH
jgi:RNA polymerase sigma factor (sigma-70 family)